MCSKHQPMFSDWKQVSEQNLQDEIILSVRKDSRKRVRWLLRTTYSTAKLHWLKCIHIQERIRLGVRKPLRSARVCVCVCVCVFSSPPPSRSPGWKHRSPPSWPDWGSADLGSAGCGSLGQNGQHATERENIFVFFTKGLKTLICPTPFSKDVVTTHHLPENSIFLH